MAPHKSFRAAGPLFAALALVMAGNGLYGTLAGIRAAQSGFDSIETGIIMSLLFGGYILGYLSAPHLIRRMGHVRIFMAMSVTAAAAIMSQDILGSFGGWSAGRLATGFCYAVMYTTVESWLNGISGNHIRARMLGFYLFVIYGAMTAGQYLLDLQPPEKTWPFAAAAAIVALGPLPLAFARNPSVMPVVQRLRLRGLLPLAPLGLWGVFTAGFGVGVLFTLGPVYAAQAGLDSPAVAHFMAAFIMGGVVGQMPLGMLSDRIGRERMIAAVSLATAGALFWCWQAMSMPAPVLYAALFCVGTFSLNLYGQCAAYTNDRLTPEQCVDAGAAQLLINGIGAFLGPFLISVMIADQGNDIFFPSLSVLYIVTGLYALHGLVKNRAALQG